MKLNGTEMSEESAEFGKLLDQDKAATNVPKAGDTVIGTVLSASKAEVRLDINGVFVGVVRARELYGEAPEYANLKPGAQVEATVIDEENENGELELSFRFAGQEKAWKGLRGAFESRSVINVKIIDANRGGLLANYAQIPGFLPVSQLAPDNYPRVAGGDKIKILEKLKSFVGQEFSVKVMNFDEKGEKIIFSEKDAWNEKQKDVIAKYKSGTRVTGKITAVTDFGVFVSFGDNLEGLIHISELAWQRIDDPGELYKVGQEIEAEVINVDGSKIFLSAKKLQKDPWDGVGEKYKINQTVKVTILKVNPFGLFVKLDNEIHGLAHVSQLALAVGEKIEELYKPGTEVELEIISIEPKEHRLGLAAINPTRNSGGALKPSDVALKDKSVAADLSGDISNGVKKTAVEKTEDKPKAEKKSEVKAKKTEKTEKAESSSAEASKDKKKAKKEKKTKKSE